MFSRRGRGRSRRSRIRKRRSNRSSSHPSSEGQVAVLGGDGGLAAALYVPRVVQDPASARLVGEVHRYVHLGAHRLLGERRSPGVAGRTGATVVGGGGG